MRRATLAVTMLLVAAFAPGRHLLSARHDHDVPAVRTAVSIELEDPIEVHPRFENMWTGRANVNGGKWSGNLAIITNPDFRAWAMFDLAAVPDTVTVTGAVLHYTTFPGRDMAFSLWRHLSSDPRAASGTVMYDECGSASVVSYTGYDAVSGPVARVLSETGIAAVQAGLVEDRVAFGWQRHASDGWRYAHGIESPGEEPFLVVTCEPGVAVREQVPEPGLRVPAVRLAGGMLFLQGSVARLLDVAGRCVLDLSAGANDVSCLAPGVYFVREDTRGAGTAARRVVIQG